MHRVLPPVPPGLANVCTRPRAEPSQVNLGSERQSPYRLPPGAPTLRWQIASRKHQLGHVAVLPECIVTGLWDEEPTPDYYDLIRPETRVIDTRNGEERIRLEGRALVGAAGSLMVCQTGHRGRHALELRRLPDGELLFERRVPGDWGFALGDGGFYLWNQQDPEWIGAPFRLDFHPWQSPESPVSISISNDNHIGHVREFEGRLALSQWSSRGSVKTQLELRAFQGGSPEDARVCRQFRLDRYQDLEAFPDEQGWVVRSPEETLGVDPEGRDQWRSTGMTRCWLTRGWLVGVPSGTRALVALDRDSGEQRFQLDQGSPWCLALGEGADDPPTLWLAERLSRRWSGWTAQGGKCWEGPQPSVGVYGIAHLQPLEGALVAVGDSGDCALFDLR